MEKHLTCVWNIVKNDPAFHLGLGIGLIGTGVITFGFAIYIAVKEVESHFK